MNNNNQNNSQDFIFGLDIGTRTVIGVVGYQQDKKFIIVAIEQQEHQSRAMMDGQIHDIDKVVITVQEVRRKLEEKIGFKLKKVGIAAAGRVLHTVQVHTEQFVDRDTVIELSHIHALELQGISTAYERLKNQSYVSDSDYFCVGYSVIRYYLNQYMISNLEGHKGNHIAMDMIATFLPQTVIDSLYTVIQKTGLEIVHLTLEPIAAIEIVIPKEIQLLNLALVDIGAGTSDIAISKEGSIIAYGMIPVAGDEITEQILHTYLTDFETAEKIKLTLAKKSQTSFKDVLGLSHKITKDELIKIIEPVVDQITLKIANKILELNGGKTPNAVFCVGGGSQITGLAQGIAKHLNLPPERVAIRGLEIANKRIQVLSTITGPEMITPLGICMTSISQSGNSFIDVLLNGQTVSLFNTNSITVIDVAAYQGFDHTNLLGRKEKDLEFTVNGQVKKIKGEVGQAAEIVLNGKVVSLHHPIHAGDQLVIKPACHGKDARISIAEWMNMEHLTIDEYIVKINGQRVSLNTYVQSGDEILLHKNNKENNKENKLKNEDLGFYIIVNDTPLYLPKKSTNYIFVEIFNYIDIDLSNPKGEIVLLLNDKQAAYTDKIHHGDNVKIYWK